MSVLFNVVLALSLLALVGIVCAWAAWRLNHGVDLTREARVICKAAFDTELPRRWGVSVSDEPSRRRSPVRDRAGYPTVLLGECDTNFRLIEIYRRAHQKVGACELRTLVHELLHALRPDLKHDTARTSREFELIVNCAIAKLWAKEASNAELQAD